MNRRDLFKGFALGAAGLLVPEPARAYSFIWRRETEYERNMRLAKEAIRASYEKFRLEIDKMSARTVPRFELRAIPGNDFLKTWMIQMEWVEL